METGLDVCTTISDDINLFVETMSAAWASANSEIVRLQKAKATEAAERMNRAKCIIRFVFSERSFLMLQFLRRLLILVEIAPSEAKPDQLRKVLLTLTEKIAVNPIDGWTDISYQTLGPNDPPGLILEMVPRLPIQIIIVVPRETWSWV